MAGHHSVALKQHWDEGSHIPKWVGEGCLGAGSFSPCSE